MWGFLSAIFNKIASAAVTVLVAVGLVSAPLPPIADAPATATTSPELAQEIVLDKPIKAEKPALPAVAKTEKSAKPKKDSNAEVKELEEKLAQTAQLLEALKKAAPLPPPAPAPVSAPAPVPAPPPTPSLPSGIFRLPNGALVDANGNIIQPAPSANTSNTSSQTTPSPAPPPPASENYSPGSAISIARNVFVAIEFNSNLDCELLGLSSANVKKCKLYRTNKSDYTWNIVD